MDWLDDFTQSQVYSDFFKPYAEKELGINGETADDRSIRNYEDEQQKVSTPSTIGGFTQNQLLIGAVGVLALAFIVKR